MSQRMDVGFCKHQQVQNNQVVWVWETKDLGGVVVVVGRFKT